MNNRKRAIAWMVGVLVMGHAFSAMAASSPRVLILLDKGFNNGEFYQSWLPLKALGYQVDIAAPERGVVYVRSDGKPDTKGRDAKANLALKEVKADDYLGLVIPGGYSPGNLEKYPESLDICRAFMKQKKLIAGVCHGPRLLMRAGLLKGRKVTCLYSVANELADDWKAGNYGTYLDQAVVVDDNLVTSRYPGDMAAFTRTIAEKLAAAGGLPVPKPGARAVVLAGAKLTGHAKWALRDGPRILGVTVDLLDNAKASGRYTSGKTYDPKKIHAILTLPGKSLDALLAAEGLKKLLEDTGLKPQSVGKVEPRYDAYVEPIVRLTEKAAAGKLAPAEAKSTATLKEALAPLAKLMKDTANAKRKVMIALRKGFDDEVVAHCTKSFKARGCDVQAIAHEQGAVKGMNGASVEAVLTYGNAKPPADALIVVPGGIFPEKANARQAEQPAWVNEQDKLDKARTAWLVEKWKDGATLLTVGFGSLRVARDPAFKGKKFACSDQTVWSFPRKTGGAYTRSPVAATDDRIVSVKSASVLKECE